MERYFIGQMIKQPDIAFKTNLQEKHFQSVQSRTLFSTIRYIVKEDMKPDVATIYAHSKEVPISELTQIEDAVASTANWEYYERQIIEQYKRIEIKRICEKVLKDTVTPSAELVSQIMQVADFTEDDENRIVSGQESLDNAIHMIEEAYTRKGETIGITSGIHSLDAKLNGFQNRRLYIVAARPSEGKTAFLINLLHNADRPVGFITAETANADLSVRLVSLESKINSEQLTSGMLKQSQFDNIGESCSHIHAKHFWYYDQANIGLDTLLLKAREMKQRYDIQALYIDYLQQITYNGRDKKHEQVAYISSALKGLARKLDIPVIVAAQLRRPPDGEPKPPKLHDIGDSGQIERDADCVVMIYHGKIQDEEGSYLIIGKNRDGATGYTQVMFKREYYGFFDIDYRN